MESTLVTDSQDDLSIQSKSIVRQHVSGDEIGLPLEVDQHAPRPDETHEVEKNQFQSQNQESNIKLRRCKHGRIIIKDLSKKKLPSQLTTDVETDSIAKSNPDPSNKTSTVSNLDNSHEVRPQAAAMEENDDKNNNQIKEIISATINIKSTETRDNQPSKSPGSLFLSVSESNPSSATSSSSSSILSISQLAGGVKDSVDGGRPSETSNHRSELAHHPQGHESRRITSRSRSKSRSPGRVRRSERRDRRSSRSSRSPIRRRSRSHDRKHSPYRRNSSRSPVMQDRRRRNRNKSRRRNRNRSPDVDRRSRYRRRSSRSPRRRRSSSLSDSLSPRRDYRSRDRSAHERSLSPQHRNFRSDRSQRDRESSKFSSRRELQGKSSQQPPVKAKDVEVSSAHAENSGQPNKISSKIDSSMTPKSSALASLIAQRPPIEKISADTMRTQASLRNSNPPRSPLSPLNDSATSDIYDPEAPIIPMSPVDSPPLSPIGRVTLGKNSIYSFSETTGEDDLPSSAVQLNHQERYLQKLNRQERVVEEVKMSLKPYYQDRSINKEQYKDVLRRAVPKICHSKNGEINPVKIRALVDAYVSKLRRTRADQA